MEIKKMCPFCGHESTLYVKDSQYNNYMRGMNIARAFDDIDAFGRELIISGVCFDCQEKVFNTPLKFHEEEWGKLLGECACCGCSIYQNHNRSKKNDSQYECPSCHTQMYLDDDGELLEVEDE